MQRWRRFLGGQVMKKLSYRWFSVENFALIRGSWVIRANRNKMAAVCNLWSSLTWTVFKLFADFCSWKGKLTSTIVLWTTLAIIMTLTSSKVNFTEWPIQRGGCCPEGPCLKTCDVRKKNQKTYNIYNSNKHLEAKILQYRKEKGLSSTFWRDNVEHPWGTLHMHLWHIRGGFCWSFHRKTRVLSAIGIVNLPW